MDPIKRFIIFNDARHTNEIGASAVTAFLTHWAVERSAPPSTQAQAKSAMLSIYPSV
jgi:Phage integrase, N-terminal SAM-like domain